MDKKFDTRMCPDNCNYRSKVVPYCGYCLHRILKEKEEDNNGGRETEIKHTK